MLSTSTIIASDPDAADATLLRQWCEAGDRTAFDQLYRRHADALWRLALGLCGHAADAEDAVQQALLNAMRGAHQWRGGAVRSWLMSITANCCREQVRRSRRREQHEHAVPPPSPAAPAADEEARSRLRQAVARLPAGYAQPVILAYIEGMTSEAIAVVLGLSAAAVRKRCERGLAQLRADRRLAMNDPAFGALLLSSLHGLCPPLPAGAAPLRLAERVARLASPAPHAWLVPALVTMLGMVVTVAAVSWAWPGAAPSGSAALAAPPPPPVQVPRPGAADGDRAILERRITVSLHESSLSEALDAIQACLGGSGGLDYYPYYFSIPDMPISRDFTQATVREVLEACTAPTWSWHLAHGHLSIYRAHGPSVEHDFSGWDFPVDELRSRILAWSRGPLADHELLDRLLDYNDGGYGEEDAVPIQVLEGDREVVQAVQAHMAAMRSHGLPWTTSEIITCGYLRLDAVVPDLLDLLAKSPSADVSQERHTIIEALGWIGDPRSVPSLAAIAESGGGWHVAHAAWLHDSYLPTLSGDVQPPGRCSVFVAERFAAVTALGRIADPTALSALRALMADQESYAPRGSAARLLARLGCRAALADIRTALALKLQGPTREHWDGEDPDTIALCWSLCHLDPSQGVADILALMQNHDVRPDVLHALYGVDDARIAPAVLALLRGDAALAQELAHHPFHKAGRQERSEPDRFLILALAQQGNMAPLVISQLKRSGDQASDWANVAAQVLGRSHEPQAERFLAQRITDPLLSPAVRGIAAYAIGFSRQPEAIRPLDAVVATDASPEVRCEAVAGLSQLSRSLPNSGPSLDGRIPAAHATLIATMMHDPDARVRLAAVKSFDYTPQWIDGMTSALMQEGDASVVFELVQWIGQVRYHGDAAIQSLHVRDRCIAALACAPPSAQPAARDELAQWIDSQPGDGQTSAQLRARLQRALIQCPDTGARALPELTSLLDAMPPAAGPPPASRTHEF